MRIILYTGKGGVGKTSIAAAAAVQSSREGLKTLVVSSDAAHSLGDAFDCKLSPEPMLLAENLWAQEIETMYEAEKGWGKVQEYITALFTAKAVKDITTEELTILPGIEDLLSLLRILTYYQKKSYDLIVVDCAPTGETLALLSFPDMFRWWMEKLFPIKKKAVKFVRPIVEPLLGIPVPSDGVMDEIDNLYHQLDEMRAVLSNREVTSVRLVVNPEKMVLKESQRSFTYLNLYNFNVDAVIINKIIPDEVNDDYFQAWKEIHKKYRQLTAASFSPVPIFEVPLFSEEVVGMEMLGKMGRGLFGSRRPADIFYRGYAQQISQEETGYVLSLFMPFTDKQDLSLNQKGEELIVKAGHAKRHLILPRTLLNYRIKGANFEDDYLRIRFGGAAREK